MERTIPQKVGISFGYIFLYLTYANYVVGIILFFGGILFPRMPLTSHKFWVTYNVSFLVLAASYIAVTKLSRRRMNSLLGVAVFFLYLGSLITASVLCCIMGYPFLQRIL